MFSNTDLHRMRSLACPLLT